MFLVGGGGGWTTYIVLCRFKFEDLRRADEFYWDKMLADEGANTLMWLDGDVSEKSTGLI